MNDIFAYFSCKSGGFGEKPMRVVYDAPLSEEYSETLDSMTIVVPHVPKADRLADLEPYQEVAVSVKMSQQGENSVRTFLVDSFVEEMESVRSGGEYYSYTVDLMSETKYLEKIQLPNLSITHSLATGQKTIRHYIELYVAQYSPKVKFSDDGATFSDCPLLTLDPDADWARMDSPCADLAMSKPTLRQALTSLMIQVGCIPTVKNRKIGFLDYRAKQTEFKASADKITVVRSMSSDSYVNTLIAEASNVVDADGASVSEELCFRDRDNVLLKQAENLFLETRFPIYSVRKLVMKAFVSGSTGVNRNSQAYWCGYSGVRFGSTTGSIRGGVYMDVDTSGSVITLKFKPFSTLSTRGSVLDGTVHFTASVIRKSEGGYSSVVRKEGDQTLKWALQYEEISSYAAITNSLFQSSYVQSGDQIVVSASFTGKAGDGIESETYSEEPAFWASGDAFETFGNGAFPVYAYRSKENVPVWFLSSEDITPLCVESSKRAQLDVDFLSMPEWSGIDGMSKWLYATVGYSIGSKRIEGFSSTYEKTTGWWDERYTYIENIIKSINFEISPVMKYWGGSIDFGGASKILPKSVISNPFFENSSNNFSVLFFDLEYIPLGEIKREYKKEESNLPISQLDSADSGVSAIDSLSAKEADSVARFGNDVLAIHQRASSWDEVQPLNSLVDGHVVFKREIKIGRNALDVSYYASKSYVIKNYFTSIVTKYRAYENVGYDQSVTRRELKWAGLMISKNGVVKSGEFIEIKSGKTLYFVDSLLGNPSGPKIENSGEIVMSSADGGASPEGIVKGEVWSVCSGPSATLCYSQFDNASNGIYVDGTYLNPNGSYKSNPIGGIPQKWYGRDESLMKGTAVYFSKISELTIPENEIFTDIGQMEGYVRQIQKLPCYKTGPDYQLISDLMVEADFGVAEKDAGERLEEVLQIEAYSDDGSLKAGKWLFRLSSAFGGYPSGGTVGIVYGGELRSQPYRPGAFQDEPSLFSLKGETDGGRCLTMEMDVSKFEKEGPAKIAVVSNGLAYDLLWMENPKDWHTMPFSLNSQKGMGVYTSIKIGGAELLRMNMEADYGLNKKVHMR